jgi:ribosomal protein S18 acetylase RimI-like enzyme
MSILHATIDHLPLIVPLFDAYRQFYGQRSDLSGASMFLRDRLRNNDSIIFLATDQTGSALGFVQLYPSFSSVSMKRLWILNDLFVTQEARHKGVAEALMARSVLLAKETKSKGLVLETGMNNEPAKRLYERSGWIEDQEFDRYYFNLV